MEFPYICFMDPMDPTDPMDPMTGSSHVNDWAQSGREKETKANICLGKGVCFILVLWTLWTTWTQGTQGHDPVNEMLLYS